ncbi:hypothetical protein ACA910_006965 [Epithemia clementina (nom. ined.)]
MMISVSEKEDSSSSVATTAPTDELSQRRSSLLGGFGKKFGFKGLAKLRRKKKVVLTKTNNRSNNVPLLQDIVKKKLLGKSSRQNMLDLICAQESSIIFMADVYEEERTLCNNVQQLYEESQVKVEQAKHQVQFTRDEMRKLHKKVSDLEEENDILRERCAKYGFLYETKAVEDFPHLCPMDETLHEGPRSIAHLIFYEILGQGQMGKVYAANNNALDEDLAVKKIEKKNIGYFESIQQLDLEVQALKICQEHPNVIDLKYTFHTRNNFYIVLDRAWTNVYEYSRIEDLSVSTLREIMIGVFSALKFIHSRSFAHLDVKPDNILLSFPESGYITSKDVRLCDFGLCVRSDNLREEGTVLDEGGRAVGTPNFFAPEMSTHKIYDAALADMWSAGASLVELTLGFPPQWEEAYEGYCQNRDGFEFSENIYDLLDGVRATFDPKESPLLGDLLLNYLLVRPKERLNSTRVFGHKWFLVNL